MVLEVLVAKTSAKKLDTLGNQKKTNYALRPDLDKEAFIKEVLTGLMPPPAYFPKNVLMNINGYDGIDNVIERGTRSLSPNEFDLIANETNALVIDTRSPRIFGEGFIPNSINISIDGSFAVWVGTLIPDIKQEILLVTELGREEEVITRLARVGYDHAIGYLKGGFDAWKSSGKEVDAIKSITAEEFAQAESNDPEINILDVRKKVNMILNI